jgi:hypothetical protein
MGLNVCDVGRQNRRVWKNYFRDRRRKHFGPLEFAVPELTRSVDIKLNKRASLQRPSNRVSISYRNCPCPDLREADPPGDYIPPGGSVGTRSMREAVERHDRLRMLGHWTLANGPSLAAIRWPAMDLQGIY